MVTPTSTGGPVNRKFMPHHENQIKLVCALGLPTYAPLERARTLFERGSEDGAQLLLLLTSYVYGPCRCNPSFWRFVGSGMDKVS